MGEPLVSIVLPVFNAEDTLAAAIRSIIRQSYSGWELIIIDDGSTDRSLDIARRFVDSRIRIVMDGRNLKLSRRLNQGIALSRGKYIARMDADDIAYPDRLETQVAFLEKHPNIDLVGGRIIIFNETGNVVGTYPFRQKHAEICRQPWAGFYLPHPTWIGKAGWFKSNPYRDNALRMEDQDLLLRTYEKSRFACLPHMVIGYRQSGLSLKNILLGRYNFSRALLKMAVNRKCYNMILGVFVHTLKAIIDTFAIVTGLDYRVLQHRALSVSGAEIEKWERVWIDCNTGTY